MLDTTDFTETADKIYNNNHNNDNNNNNYYYYYYYYCFYFFRVKLAVHVDFSGWNSSQRRFFCHRILQISRISRKRDQVANLGQILFSFSCQLSHFGLRNNSV